VHGPRSLVDPTTPVRTETDPVLRVGGLGQSSDPFNGRAVPCAGPPGPALLGCEACGAPPTHVPTCSARSTA
jgi:hypothetical protein